MTTDKTHGSSDGTARGRGNYRPKLGPWGVGVSTTRVRVPDTLAPHIAVELRRMLYALQQGKEKSQHTRNWVEFDRLIAAVEKQCPHLMNWHPPSH